MGGCDALTCLHLDVLRPTTCRDALRAVALRSLTPWVSWCCRSRARQLWVMLVCAMVALGVGLKEMEMLRISVS